MGAIGGSYQGSLNRRPFFGCSEASTWACVDVGVGVGSGVLGPKKGMTERTCGGVLVVVFVPLVIVIRRGSIVRGEERDLSEGGVDLDRWSSSGSVWVPEWTEGEVRG